MSSAHHPKDHHHRRNTRSHSLDSQRLSSQLHWLWKKLGTNPSSSNSTSTSSGALHRRHSIDPDRRRAGPNVGKSKDDHHAAHNYRGIPITAHPSDQVELDIQYLAENEQLMFHRFFRSFRCYDVIPGSGKLIIFDTNLLVKKAFFALVENGIRAAPLYDAKTKAYIGMLTITDFIHILRTYYRSPNVEMEELEGHKIETWRNVLEDRTRPLVSIGPEESLLTAIRMLIENKVHRLPVINPQNGNVLYIITHKRILKFLKLHYSELPIPSYMKETLGNLKIGTYDKIATVKPDTPVIQALAEFIERRVSALPVVDDSGKVVDIYAKFDVIYLASEGAYNNLDITVTQALDYRSEHFEGVLTCTLDETFSTVLERITDKEVHRLVVIDQESQVIGMISLSDILSYLVLRYDEPVVAAGDATPQSSGGTTPDVAVLQKSLSLEIKDLDIRDKDLN